MAYKKQRKTKTYLAFGFLFIMLIAIGLYLQPFSIDTSARSGDFISVPTFGYLKCEQADTMVTTPETGWYRTGGKNITCQEFSGQSLIQGCDITIRSPTREEITGSHAGIVWSVCTVGEPCGEKDKADTVKILRGAGGVPYVYKNSNINQEWNIRLNPNQYLWIGYNRGNIWKFEWRAESLARIKMSYTPYQIYRYDVFSMSNGRPVPDTLDCANGNALTESNFLIENVRGGGALTQNLQKAELLDMNAMRSRGAITTYISNFVKIIPQYNLFDNDMKYCYDKNIYAVEEIVTPRGTYKVADIGSNKVIAKVECCNSGDVPSGYYCENFKPKPLSQSEGAKCRINADCPITGFQAIQGEKVASQSCVSGTCVTEFTDVECNFHEECPNGYCEVDSRNPKNNKCVFIDVQQYCGNGVCEASRGETIETCPQDCRIPPSPPKQVDSTLLFIILGFVLIILIMIVVRIKMNKKSGGIGF